MLRYLIYLLAFVAGSIWGLLYSYKLHGEPFVADRSLNIPYTIISAVGWILAFDSGNVILSGIGFILAGFVMGGRPGYGRKETAIGLVLAIVVYILLHWAV